MKMSLSMLLLHMLMCKWFSSILSGSKKTRKTKRDSERRRDKRKEGERERRRQRTGREQGALHGQMNCYRERGADDPFGQRRLHGRRAPIQASGHGLTVALVALVVCGNGLRDGGPSLPANPRGCSWMLRKVLKGLSASASVTPCTLMSQRPSRPTSFRVMWKHASGSIN